MANAVKREFIIRNNADGMRWWIGALESDIKAYCWSKGLEIKVFKSGWLFQHISFVIKGVATTQEAYNYADDLTKIYESYVV